MGSVCFKYEAVKWGYLRVFGKEAVVEWWKKAQDNISFKSCLLVVKLSISRLEFLIFQEQRVMYESQCVENVKLGLQFYISNAKHQKQDEENIEGN